MRPLLALVLGLILSSCNERSEWISTQLRADQPSAIELPELGPGDTRAEFELQLAEDSTGERSVRVWIQRGAAKPSAQDYAPVTVDGQPMRLRRSVSGSGKARLMLQAGRPQASGHITLRLNNLRGH